MAFAASTAVAAESGELRVRAVDATGGLITRAKVTVLDSSRETVATSETNDSGEVQLRDLAPGPYKVEIVATGFATFGKEIETGEKPATVLAALKLGSLLGDTVMVEPLPLLPQPAPSQLQTTPKKRRLFGWFR